jgi:5'-nucleotidase
MTVRKKTLPLVVVSNDDGVRAEGIRALAKALESIADVWVVAPETEQSSMSHALSLAKPLRIQQHAPKIWAVDGTPADCTYVALHHKHLLPRKPALVVSGINHGSNLGTDVFYSGTVAAAREAALRGTTAVAFSMPWRSDVRACAVRARTFVARLLSWRTHHPKAPPVLLNVNFPEKKPLGTRSCVLGVREYDNLVEVRSDPRGRQYLWIGGPSTVKHPRIKGSDTEAFEAGYTSITTLRLDVSDGSENSAALALIRQ